MGPLIFSSKAVPSPPACEIDGLPPTKRQTDNITARKMSGPEYHPMFSEASVLIANLQEKLNGFVFYNLTIKGQLRHNGYLLDTIEVSLI